MYTATQTDPADIKEEAIYKEKHEDYMDCDDEPEDGEQEEHGEPEEIEDDADPYWTPEEMERAYKKAGDDGHNQNKSRCYF